LDWSSDAQAEQKQLAGLHEETLALWQPMAGWIQTQCLVKAQLAHPQITIRFGVSVSKLVRHELSWHLLDSSGQPIAQAHHVVIANAHGCQDLLDSVEASEAMSNDQRPLIPITPLRGQVTFGDMNLLSPNLKEKLPPFPLNGHGSYIGNLPSLHSPQSSPYWIVGSSFQRFDFDTRARSEDQISNLQQWAELMPAWHDEILESIDLSKANAWAGIRAALPDRLPAVGAFQHPDFAGLQVCTGMGARGISWSVLCAELLAAHLNHEPLPMAASLAKHMAASRFG
jgi:tRNA 5-methylaminomethyl-2-thiouridine biosynthesis bifunctional protein